MKNPKPSPPAEAMFADAPYVPLRWKMNFIGIFIAVVFFIILNFLILPRLGAEKLEERKGKLKAVVDSVVSLMDHYEKALRKQAWQTDPSMPGSIDEAKARLIRDLRSLRYDKNEYVFILDGNGRMVMHPLKAEFEGINMLQVETGEALKPFREMVIDSQRDGESFVSYVWQSKHSPSIFEPQTTYSRYFWPWDWVVCSGVYTQDLIDSKRNITIISGIYLLITAIVTMILLLVMVHLNLTRPLKALLLGIGQIQQGNLRHQIDIAPNNELGFISRQFNRMVSDLRANREKIVRSEKQYRELTGMLPDIIYETDLALRICYANEAFFRLTDFRQADLDIGLDIADILEADNVRTFQRVLGKPVEETESIFIGPGKIRKKDGGYFYGEINTAIIFEDDRPAGLRGVIRDVTDKLKLEERLVQSQKMETVGTLAGGIAHDFNNVLSGIVGTLSILKYEMSRSDVLTREMLGDSLDMIEKSADRATEMVQHLLTLSRRHELSFSPVDLNTVIGHVMKIVQNSFDKSIDLTFSVHPEAAMVSADATQLEQILLNLCLNASHAMTVMRRESEHHGGRLSVAVNRVHADNHFCSVHPEAEKGDYWNLVVSDTGVGMDSRTVAKIFDPFFTTKEKGVGTGLGLAMVYNLVLQHHGFMDVSTEAGSGTTFNVYLPVLAEHQPIREEAAGPERMPVGWGLILVVDDEEVVRQNARTILETCGYSVICAENGQQGVELFRKNRHEIQAVLLDMVMPKKSGRETYLEMKQIDADIKVVLSSGFRKDDRVEEIMGLGVQRFLQKPYTMEKLAGAIHAVIQDTRPGRTAG